MSLWVNLVVVLAFTAVAVLGEIDCVNGSAFTFNFNASGTYVYNCSASRPIVIQFASEASLAVVLEIQTQFDVISILCTTSSMCSSNYLELIVSTPSVPSVWIQNISPSMSSLSLVVEVNASLNNYCEVFPSDCAVDALNVSVVFNENSAKSMVPALQGCNAVTFSLVIDSTELTFDNSEFQYFLTSSAHRGGIHVRNSRVKSGSLALFSAIVFLQVTVDNSEIVLTRGTLVKITSSYMEDVAVNNVAADASVVIVNSTVSLLDNSCFLSLGGGGGSVSSAVTHSTVNIKTSQWIDITEACIGYPCSSSVRSALVLSNISLVSSSSWVRGDLVSFEASIVTCTMMMLDSFFVTLDSTTYEVSQLQCSATNGTNLTLASSALLQLFSAASVTIVGSGLTLSINDSSTLLFASTSLKNVIMIIDQVIVDGSGNSGALVSLATTATTAYNYSVHINNCPSLSFYNSSILCLPTSQLVSLLVTASALNLYNMSELVAHVGVECSFNVAVRSQSVMTVDSASALFSLDAVSAAPSQLTVNTEAGSTCTIAVDISHCTIYTLRDTDSQYFFGAAAGYFPNSTLQLASSRWVNSGPVPVSLCPSPGVASVTLIDCSNYFYNGGQRIRTLNSFFGTVQTLREHTCAQGVTLSSPPTILTTTFSRTKSSTQASSFSRTKSSTQASSFSKTKSSTQASSFSRTNLSSTTTLGKTLSPSSLTHTATNTLSGTESSTTKSRTNSATTRNSSSLKVLEFPTPAGPYAFVGVAASSAAVGTIVLSGDAVMAASQVLVSIVSCNQQSSGNPLPQLNALAISVFYYSGPRAIVYGNTALIVGTVLLHACATWLSSQRSSTTFAKSAGDALRFPALSVTLSDFLLSGVMFGSVVCFMRRDEERSVALATAGVCVCVAVVAVRQLVLEMVVLPQAAWEVYRHRAEQLAKWDARWYPAGRWAPKPLRNAYGPLVATMKRRFARYRVAEVAVSLLLAAAAASGMTALSPTVCRSTLIASAAVSGLFAAFCVVTRPFRYPMNRVVVPLCYAVLGVSCALKSLSPDALPNLLLVTTILDMLQTVLLVWRGLWMLWIAYRETIWEDDSPDGSSTSLLSLLSRLASVIWFGGGGTATSTHRSFDVARFASMEEELLDTIVVAEDDDAAINCMAHGNEIKSAYSGESNRPQACADLEPRHSQEACYSSGEVELTSTDPTSEWASTVNNLDASWVNAVVNPLCDTNHGANDFTSLGNPLPALDMLSGTVTRYEDVDTSFFGIENYFLRPPR